MNDTKQPTLVCVICGTLVERVPSAGDDLLLHLNRLDVANDHTPLLAEWAWTVEDLIHEFEVLGFAAPFVIVQRRADGAKGTLEYTHTHTPRVYFNWRADNS